MTPLIGLVDCNNFFVSCERAHNPLLNGKPVVVLSNNDGCVISRSNEAKTLGVKMGQPFFDIRYLVHQHDIVVLSANMDMVTYMSGQVMAVLAQFTPTLEVYSVDEAFLDMTGQKGLYAYGQCIRQTVMDEVGVPVSVGFARTKTLAKLAAELAKTSKKACSVVDLSEPTYHDVALRRIPIHDVWGVGRRLTRRLQWQGITTAQLLRDCDANWAAQTYGSLLARTILELRGQPCIPLETGQTPHKTIIASRSFGMRVTRYHWLQEALATYTARAAEKLRQDRQLAGQLTVHIRTGRHNPQDPYYANDHTIVLASPTLYTPTLIQAAWKGLGHIYQAGYRYYKAGVMLSQLTPANEHQLALWDDHYRFARHASLMQSVDRLNKRFRYKVQYAAEGFEKPWRGKSQHRTDWTMPDNTEPGPFLRFMS
jgi:DNA polymerase V